MNWSILSLLGFVGICSLLAVKGCGGCHCSDDESRALCIERQRGLRTALLLYTNDYDDFFPPSGEWQDATTPYVGVNTTNYVCPSVEPLGSGNFGIAFNESLAGVNVTTISAPGTFSLIFDSTILDRNAESTTSTLPSPARHGVNVIMRLDGVAASVPPPN